MNTEQFENILNNMQSVSDGNGNTQIATNDGNAASSANVKRHYTNKEDMEKGNNAILACLPEDARNAIGKAEILATMDIFAAELVERNWNLRMKHLELNGKIKSVGWKAGKKYYRPA